jgi:hypothetical protein
MKRFLGLIAAASILLLLTGGVQAQNRNLGARTFTMDDGAGHTYTMQTPGSPGAMAGSVTYTLPLPPTGAGPAGYVNVGTVAGQTLFWNGTTLAWEASSVITNNTNGNGTNVTITAPLIGAGAGFTTLASSGATTLGTAAGLTNSFGSGGTATNSFGSSASNNNFGGNANQNHFGGGSSQNIFSGSIESINGSTYINTNAGLGFTQIGNASNSVDITSTGWSVTAAGTLTATSLVGPLTGHASSDLALAGGTMSGSINMGGSRIASLATPSTSTDAANKSYVDAGDATNATAIASNTTAINNEVTRATTAEGTKLPLAGGTMTGDIAMGSHNISGGGTFTATTFTGALNGNANTATTAGSATNFTGNLAGDVTGTQGATVVANVGGKTAAQVANAVTVVGNATSANTASTLVLRDGSGNFTAGTVTAGTAVLTSNGGASPTYAAAYHDNQVIAWGTLNPNGTLKNSFGVGSTFPFNGGWFQGYSVTLSNWSSVSGGAGNVSVVATFAPTSVSVDACHAFSISAYFDGTYLEIAADNGGPASAPMPAPINFVVYGK